VADLSDVHVGEAQVELDLRRLIEPVVRETQIQLGAVAVAVVGLGIACGVGFVALLIGPIRRLRAGVERLTAGDLAARVPPTSTDEVGELTRAFNEMGESLQQKERIQRAFGRYASDYVLNALLETPEGTEVEGAEREVTLMFVDVRGFTRMSEGLKARDVVSLLNDVFQLVSDAILQRGGTLDKFIGDSVMAYFGAPIPSADHAVQAVNTAVDIMRANRNRNRSLAPGEQACELGIGIHTGPVVVGNIGSDRRTDFTAIGDAVNVAARLEKLAKPGEILVTEAVQRRVRGAHRLRFEGERQLSGRVEPVHVYAVEVPELETACRPGAPRERYAALLVAACSPARPSSANAATRKATRSRRSRSGAASRATPSSTTEPGAASTRSSRSSASWSATTRSVRPTTRSAGAWPSRC
jgi:class 3 adenylate cyclase